MRFAMGWWGGEGDCVVADVPAKVQACPDTLAHLKVKTS